MEQITSLWPRHALMPSQPSFLPLLWEKSRNYSGNTCFLRLLSHGGKEEHPIICLSYKEMDHKEMLLSPHINLLVRGGGGSYPSHCCFLPASGVSNSPAWPWIEFSMDIFVLHFSFLSKYVLIILGRKEDEIQHLFLESNLASKWRKYMEGPS